MRISKKQTAVAFLKFIYQSDIYSDPQHFNMASLSESRKRDLTPAFRTIHEVDRVINEYLEHPTKPLVLLPHQIEIQSIEAVNLIDPVQPENYNVEINQEHNIERENDNYHLNNIDEITHREMIDYTTVDPAQLPPKTGSLTCETKVKAITDRRKIKGVLKWRTLWEDNSTSWEQKESFIDIDGAENDIWCDYERIHPYRKRKNCDPVPRKRRVSKKKKNPDFIYSDENGYDNSEEYVD